MSDSLLREDYFVNISDKIISCYDQEHNRDNLTIWRYCEKMCKPECYMKYYSIEVERYDNQNRIFIRHDENPDIFVEHIPEVNLIGIVCNFGGLLGMWSELSIFTLFNDTLHLITMIFYRTNTINIILKGFSIKCRPMYNIKSFFRRNKNT